MMVQRVELITMYLSQDPIMKLIHIMILTADICYPSPSTMCDLKFYSEVSSWILESYKAFFCAHVSVVRLAEVLQQAITHSLIWTDLAYHMLCRTCTMK